MDTPVMEAYTTNAILGGMTMAMELEVAISAVENGALKPPLSTIAGTRTAPRAATVAGAGTGNCTEEAGYNNAYDCNTASSVSHTGINEFNKSFGNSGLSP